VGLCWCGSPVELPNCLAADAVSGAAARGGAGSACCFGLECWLSGWLAYGTSAPLAGVLAAWLTAGHAGSLTD
jgi:hypothetical protein